MKILDLLKSGAFRSFRAWKGILVIWLTTLSLVSLIALPLKAGINAVIGKSMITGLLYNGINVDFLVDLGKTLAVIVSSFSSGFLIIIILVLVMNSFLSAGIFTILKTDERNPRATHFFAGGAFNFRSFFIITLVNTLIIFILFILILVIPLSVINGSESEGSVIKTGKILLVVFAAILPVFMLVADNARAWNISSGKNAGFRSLGKGFRLTFGNFPFSYVLMMILFIVQIIFGWLVFKFISGIHPMTDGGVIMLFMLSQLLFVIRIILRVWRYGTISSLVERGITDRASGRVNADFEI